MTQGTIIVFSLSLFLCYSTRRCPAECLSLPGDIVAACSEPCGEVAVPVDFMLYLYPPMYYCRIGCLNVELNQPGISTFRDTSGYYGHLLQDPAVTAPPSGTSSKWVYSSPGTGLCAIAGGGITNTTLFDFEVCRPSANAECNSTDSCPGECP